MLELRARPLAELVPRTPSGERGGLRATDVPRPLPGHVGLWLDRVIAQAGTPAERSRSGDESRSKANPERLRLYEVATQALRPGDTEEDDPPAVASYRPLFARWLREVERRPPGILRRAVKVEARTRILLHTASNETVTEGSLLFHHSYGVPYLPGSGLKGVLRRRLSQALPEQGDHDLAGGILGRQGREGAPDLSSWVDLLDALWVPERPRGLSGEWSPLAVDVVTPHHPEYMTARSGGTRRLPTDRDEPTPVHRLTIAPGARFLVALEVAEAPGAREWLDELVDSMLLPALEQEGFGAWTAAGYGRLAAIGDVSGGSGPTSRSAAAEAEPQRAEWIPALVVRDAGSGRLSAALEDGRKAAARGREAARLLETLPFVIQEKLKDKRKSAHVEVQVEAMGVSWQLVAVRPLGE